MVLNTYTTKNILLSNLKYMGINDIKNFAITSEGGEYFEHDGWYDLISKHANTITTLLLHNSLSNDDLLKLQELTLPNLKVLAINFDPKSKSIKPFSFSSIAPLLKNLTVPFQANSILWHKENPGLANVIGQ